MIGSPLYVEPSTDGGGGGEASAPTPQRVYGAFHREQLSPAWTTCGYLDLDPSVWPATVGSLSRVLRFVALVEVDSSGVTLNLRLVKLPATAITDSDIASTVAAESDVERLASAALAVGGGSGLSSGSARYRVQAQLVGGVGGEVGTIHQAYLEATWE